MRKGSSSAAMQLAEITTAVTLLPRRHHYLLLAFDVAVLLS